MASKSKCKGYELARKYHKEWEQKFPWLRQSADGSNNAECRYCHVVIAPKISSFHRHEESSKHKQRIPPTSSKGLLSVEKTPRDRPTKGPSDIVKKAEIELAVSVACHCSIKAIDHFSELITRHVEGSVLGKIKLHRTKCASILRNAVAPVLKDELKRDISGKKFSLLTDESTDVSTQKLLCMAVVFVSDSGEIKVEYLGLVPVLQADATTLFQALEKELGVFGQKIENCIGLSSDGASVMVGKHNSVFTRIKEQAPQCLQLKCICHSLALCIQHAFCKLPSNIAFLLREVPGWFSHSAIRRDAFATLFNVMNVDTGLESGSSHPTPFLKTSATRWLVRGKVMFNILVNWHELSAYFSVVEISIPGQPDFKYKARLLKELFQDQTNYLYFHFATPVVQEFERVNAIFQSTKEDPHHLSKELDLMHQSLRGRLYNNEGQKKALEDCDLGSKFLSECSRHVKKFDEGSEQEKQNSKITQVKQRCRDMLEEALEQVDMRLPETSNLFKNLSLLNPALVLNQVKRPSFKDLPFQHHITASNAALIEDQYRRVIFVDWSEEPAFKKDGIPGDSAAFWTGVRKSTGFRELADYALNCLIVPVSNAIVVFLSSDHKNKTKK